MEIRPKIKIELTSIDKLIEIKGWVLLLILWGLTIYSLINLPAIIPTHFSFNGQPDNFGSKSIVLLLPIVGTILFAGMTILNKYPHVFNYPKRITVENALFQYTIATKMLRYLKTALVLIFSLIVLFTYTTAIGKTNGLGLWFLPVVLGLVFIPMAYFITKLVKAGK